MAHAERESVKVVLNFLGEGVRGALAGDRYAKLNRASLVVFTRIAEHPGRP
ncbi:MAG: hypothetical protein ABIT38_04745 [Gemmatimonadaceae bacterium]